MKKIQHMYLSLPMIAPTQTILLHENDTILALRQNTTKIVLFVEGSDGINDVFYDRECCFSFHMEESLVDPQYDGEYFDSICINDVYWHVYMCITKKMYGD